MSVRLSVDAVIEFAVQTERERNAMRAALETIARVCGDYGDGAPDAHPLAHTMLNLESIAKAALAKAGASSS